MLITNFKWPIQYQKLHLKKEFNNNVFMSGDNLHGSQPIKFYSEKITLTKVELLERQLS